MTDYSAVYSGKDYTLQKEHATLLRHNAVLRNEMQSVLYIQQGLQEDDLLKAAEAWIELDESDQRALWVAYTKGGMFTAKERELIRKF